MRLSTGECIPEPLTVRSKNQAPSDGELHGVIALDSGVRLEGVPALHFWESVLNVMGVKRAKGLPCSLKASPSGTEKSGAASSKTEEISATPADSSDDKDFIDSVEAVAASLAATLSSTSNR